MPVGITLSPTLSSRSLAQRAQSLLRRKGGALLLPKTGDIFEDSVGTTAASLDGVVGRVNCAVGSGLYASQATAGYKPKLRDGDINYLLQSESYLSPWVKHSSVSVTDNGDYVVATQPSVAEFSMLSQPFTIPTSVSSVTLVVEARAVDSLNSFGVRLCKQNNTSITEVGSRIQEEGWTRMCLYVKSPTYSDALLRIFQGNGALSSIALKKSIGVYEGLPLGVYACGDSIGAYAEEYPSKYYAFDSFIPKYAAAKRATLVNDCVSGYEIAQAQTKLTAAISTYGSADLCILHVGINNIINAASDPSTAMQSPMTTLISDATGFASKVVVVGVHKYDTYKSSWVDNFNAWLSAHCASLENVTYIDADALWWDSDAGSVVPEYFPEDDYIHPNIAGHAALAEHIASLVQIEPNIPEYVATTDAPKSNGVGPDWADFDGVDDMMAIAAPGAAYNACTIIQSLKDVGHVTSTAQDISAGRTLNTDNWCGEIIVPSGSSLTAEELALLEKYADKIGGL